MLYVGLASTDIRVFEFSADANPLPGAAVTLSGYASDSSSTALTTSTGEVSFDLCPRFFSSGSDAVAISIAKDGYAGESGRVNIGQSVEVVLRKVTLMRPTVTNKNTEQLKPQDNETTE